MNGSIGLVSPEDRSILRAWCWFTPALNAAGGMSCLPIDSLALRLRYFCSSLLERNWWSSSGSILLQKKKPILVVKVIVSFPDWQTSRPLRYRRRPKDSIAGRKTCRNTWDDSRHLSCQRCLIHITPHQQQYESRSKPPWCIFLFFVFVEKGGRSKVVSWWSASTTTTTDEYWTEFTCAPWDFSAGAYSLFLMCSPGLSLLADPSFPCLFWNMVTSFYNSFIWWIRCVIQVYEKRLKMRRDWIYFKATL